MTVANSFLKNIFIVYNSTKLFFLVLLTLSFSCCSPKYLHKLVNGHQYAFKSSTIKSNNCIRVQLPWLDKIIRNKGIYVEVDDRVSNGTIDTRYLGDEAYYLFERNKQELNTSICFETQEQIMNVFGKRDLFDAPFLPNGKTYILEFYKLSEPQNKNFGWTGRATFNSKGKRESISFFRIIVK